MMSSVVNPLAAPKGVKLTCELCQKPAYVQCTQCRVTCYCCEAHQREDWSAIHEKICDVLSALHSSQSHASTKDERTHRDHQQMLRKRHIVSVALQEGRRLLYSGHAALAIPAALQAVRYLTELRAADGASADIAPAYLILSEAAIQLGRLSEAEQYLSQVQWLVLQSSSPPPSLLAPLHRNLGQLSAAQGKLAEARRHFAEDVYQSSLAHGTESTQTAGGYFHMGAVFNREGRLDIATSLHDQVISTWHGYLSQLAEDSKPHLDASIQAEATYVLQSISDLRGRSPQTPPTPVLSHTLALLQHVTGDNRTALMYVQQAVDLCPQGDTLYPVLKSFLDKLSEAVSS